MKGLSSTALQKATSLAQPRLPRSAVRRAASLMIRPMRATASILIPLLVLATFTLEQTFSVSARAWGMAATSFRSAAVKPLCTRAEKPPMKFTPVSSAARSRVRAKGT